MRPVVQTVLRLHLESRPYHREIDAPWLALHEELAVDTYARQLVRCYGFEAPLEAALCYTPHLPSLIDLRRRSLSGLIAQDLLELGMSAAQIAHIPAVMLAPFQNVAEGLGWLYVLERSRVVHGLLRSDVAARLPEARHACSYLDASHDIAAERWTVLGELIERVARTTSIERRVLAGVHDGFRQLLAWYRERAPHTAQAP